MIFRHLYAPWRAEYTEDVIQGKTIHTTQAECIFCTQLNAQEDERYFVIARYEYNAVLLNLYPYNAGHLLILPYVHVPTLHDLSSNTRAEMMEIISTATVNLASVLKAEGFNIGFNVGKIAGAGIPSHIHGHVLPRFHGDTNFMPTLTGTKHISIDLHTIYKKLCDIWHTNHSR